MASVTIKDTGWSLQQDLAEFDGLELQAGVLRGAQAHEGIGTASLALIHEDGAPAANIPARPYIRPTFDQNVDKYVSGVEAAVDAQVTGGAGEMRLVAVADKMAEDQRETIYSSKTGGPPLRPMTPSQVARRRFGLTPLVDTGRMVESLQGQVVKVRVNINGG